MKEFSNMHIDIMVFMDDVYIPIELKYKTSKSSVIVDGEPYHLKYHGAQDLGRYDCLKDVQRLELLTQCDSRCRKGYAIWLTNDISYLSPPKRNNTVYEQFSIHDGAIKTGIMHWLPHASAGTVKNREMPITLNNSYKIYWKTYSTVDCTKGSFYYIVVEVD